MSGNPLKTITNAISMPITIVAKTLGAQSLGDVMEDKLGTPNAIGGMEEAGNPPTLEDAKKNAAGKGGPATYGRMGTIKNIGGSKGVASSLLNLSSPSLMGK